MFNNWIGLSGDQRQSNSSQETEPPQDTSETFYTLDLSELLLKNCSVRELYANSQPNPGS